MDKAEKVAKPEEDRSFSFLQVFLKNTLLAAVFVVLGFMILVRLVVGVEHVYFLLILCTFGVALFLTTIEFVTF